MYRISFILITLFSFTIIPAHAQSWHEKQQIYNEQSRIEAELFQQRQEMERLRQETKKQGQEILRQKSEQDQSLQEIRKQNNKMLYLRDSEKTLREIEQRKYDDKRKELQDSYIEEMNNKMITEENSKNADLSEFVLSNDYYANNEQAFIEKGFSLAEAKKLNDLHRNFVYRIGRSAVKGDPEAQFMLGIMYHYGFTKLYSAAHLRKLSEVYQLIANTPDLSPEEKREVIIDGIDATLENGNDSAYVAVCVPKLPIVNRDDGKALEWLQKAAEQKHVGALLAIRSMGDRVSSQSMEVER